MEERSFISQTKENEKTSITIENNTDNGFRPELVCKSTRTGDVIQLFQFTENANRWRLQRRHLVCFLAFCGLFCMMALRLNLNVAIVAMTSSYSVTLENGTIIEKKEFNWDSTTKGLILGSFFYGYFISEIPSGWLSNRYGGATVFGLQVTCSALSTLLIPFVADYGPYAIFFFRLLTGLFEGGALPGVHSIWSRWAPLQERSRLVAISLNGPNIASVACFPLYGILVEYYGWRALFYIPVGIVILWSTVWFLQVTNDPADDSRITKKELKYIQNTVGKKQTRKGNIPWKKLLTSAPVWIVVFAYVCQSWAAIFLLTELPSYFKDVWKMNVKKSGFLLSIPYIAKTAVAFFSGVLADYLTVRRKIALTKVRKWLQAVSGIGQTIFFLLIAYSNSPIMAIVALTMSNLHFSLSYSTLFVSPLDLAPDCASIIMGIMTTGSSLTAIISPMLCGFIVKNQVREEWTIMYLICAALNIVGTSTYLLFGTAETQPWADANNKGRRTKK